MSLLKREAIKGGIKNLFKRVKPKPKPNTKPSTSITTTKPASPSIFPSEMVAPFVGSGKAIQSTLRSIGRNPGRPEGSAVTGAIRAAGYGGVPAAGLYMGLTGDGDEGMQASKPQLPSKEVEVESSDALKDILKQKTMEIAIEAGRESPVFFDYVKAFPSSYMEKVSRDPEFAKQMMAGFLAMMQPSQGFVPRNAISDFGQAAMAEEARQEAAMTDQEQLLEMSNEDIDRLQKIQRGATPRDATKDASEASAVEGIIKEILYGSKASKKDKVYDKQGNVLSKFELLQIYRESDGDINIIKDSVSAGA